MDDLSYLAETEKKEYSGPDLSYLSETPKDKAAVSLKLVHGMNPVKEAENLAVSKETGLPIAAIRENEETAKNIAFENKANQVLSVSPKTAEFLSDPNNAALTKDDLEGLSGIEKTINEDVDLYAQNQVASYDNMAKVVSSIGKQAGRFPYSLGKFVNDAAAFTFGSLDAAAKGVAEITGFERGGAFGATEKAALNNSEIIQKFLQTEPILNLPEEKRGRLWDNPQYLLDPEYMAFNTGEAAQSMLPMVAATLAGGPGAGALVGSMQEGGDLYTSLREKGVSQERAAEASIAFGLVVGYLNKIGLERLVMKIPVGSLASRISHRITTGAIEGTTEYLEEPFQAAFGAMAEGKDYSEIEADVIASLKNVEVIPGSFILGAGMNSSISERMNIDQAEAFQEKQEKINQAVNQSATKERSPEIMAQFLRTAGLGEEVFISPEGVKTLFQNDPEAAAGLLNRIGVDPEKAIESVLAGQPIRADITSLHSMLEPAEFKQLLPDLKPAPGAYSQRESENVDILGDMGRAAEMFEEAVQDQTGFQTELDRIRQQVTKAGQGIEGLTPDYVENYVGIIERFSNRMALEGQSRVDLLKKLEFRKEHFAKGGENFNQQNLEKVLAEFENFKTGVPVKFNYVHNTESATKLFGKPKKDSPYDRGYEPSGRYVTHIGSKAKEIEDDRLVYGELELKNPLVIRAEGWKRELSSLYGGLSGKRLSQAIIKSGYDGVVTIGKYGTSEILDLTTFQPDLALYQDNKIEFDTLKNLFVAHNLTAANIKHVEKIGGLAIPSLAISRKETPISGFGDITLIADPEILKDKAMKAFNADIYSPRYPTSSIVYEIDRKASNDFIQKYEPLRKEIDGESIYSLVEEVKDKGVVRALSYDYTMMYAYLKEIGKAPKIGKDRYDSRTAIRKKFTEKMKPKFDNWIVENFSNLVSGEKLFNGFTYSGNRRYLPHNLDTVVKILKKELKDGEGFNYGVPSIRAVVAKQFKSIKSIQKDRDTIISTEDMEVLKKEVNEEFSDLAADDFIPYLRYKRQVGDTDTVSEHLKEAATRGFRYVAKEYYDGLPEESMKKGAEFLDKLRNMPTEYFEIKAQRVMQLSEFTAAVVPKETDKQTIDILKKNGIKQIRYYKKGDKEGRQKAIEGVKGVFFQSGVNPLDAKYLQAVESGDMETAQKMVDEAARLAGYKEKAFKGYSKVDYKTGKPINTIRRPSPFPTFGGRKEWLNGIAGFFSNEKIVAQRFANSIALPETTQVGEFRLKLGNMKLINGEDRAAGNIQFGLSGGEFQDAIESGRYDSILIANTSDEGDVYVMMNPGFIKSADPVTYDDQGKVIPLSKRFDLNNPDIRYQRDIWFSQLEKSIEGIKQETAPASQWKAMITKLPIKPDELEWVGLNEWLDSQTGKVSKQDILDFVQANNVQIEEVVKSEYANQLTNEEANRLRELQSIGTNDRTDDEVSEYLELKERANQDISESPKFSQYQTPGGENYKELLLTMPTEMKTVKRISWAVFNKLGEPVLSTTNELKAKNKAKEIGGSYEQETEEIPVKDFYKSSHFEEPNILAHVRFNEKTGPNGERVLFIEEIQSDWGQDGRKKGYKLSDSQAKELEQLEKKLSSLHKEKYGEFDPLAILRNQQPATDEMLKIRDRIDELEAVSGNIPSHPFKKSWPLLTIKRMVRYAAENGFDTIAWTPGEIQADRYDLSKQVDEIGYAKDKNGNYEIQVFKNSDMPLQTYKNITEAGLENYVGKEVAKKIVDGVGVVDEDLKILSGLDLKVGGEGMKGFYDKILPAEVNKFFNKKMWGGAKVGVMDFGTVNQDAQPYFDKDTGKDVWPTLQGWSLPITPEMKEKALSEGMPMFQDQNSPRGAITVMNDKYLISLFDKANLSTLIHETGHIFLEEMTGLINSGSASKEIQDDYNTIMKWLEADQTLETRHHEKFARGFEAYLMEGKAPTLELESAFARFRRWLQEIYKSIRNLDVDLTDSVRQVFDRLLSAEMEIKTSAYKHGIAPKTKAELDALGVIDEDQAYLKRLMKQAEEKAADALIKDRNANHRKLRKEWVKDAKDQVNRDPGQKFADDLSKWEGVDRDELISEYGKVVLDKLPKRVPQVFRSGGIPLEEAAFLGGFNSPDDMVLALRQVLPKKEAIKMIVDQKQAEHDAQYKPEDYIAATDEYADYLSLIGRYLSGPVAGASQGMQGKTQKGISRQALKSYAGKVMQSKSVRDAIRHDVYLNAMKQAAAEERKAALAKDYNAASMANEKVRFNHELAGLAVKNRKQLEKIIKNTKAASKSKTIENDFREAIRSLAQRFNLASVAPLQPESLPPLSGLIEGSEFTDGFPASDFILNGTVRDYRNLSMAELEEVGNLIGYLVKKGRGERNAMLADGKTLVEEAANQSREEMETLPDKKVKDRLSIFRKMDDVVRRGFAMLDSLQFIAIALGGYQNIGKKGVKSRTEELIVNPLIAARDTEDLRNAEVFTRLQPHLTQLQKTIREWNKKYGKRIRVEGVTTPDLLTRDGQKNYFTGEQIISIALNLGNTENIQRIFKGYPGLTWDNVDKLVNLMSIEDMNAIQGVWDVIESLYEDTAAVYKRMNGFPMGKVEAKPFVFQGEQYQGGYYPARYNPRLSDKAASFTEKEDLLSRTEAIHQIPASKSGMTKQRQSNVSLPIKLSLSVATDHLRDTLHYITHAEAIRDIDRIIRHPVFSEGAKAKLGTQVYEMIRPALKYVARPQRETVDMGMDKLVDKLKGMTTAYMLAYNASVTAQQMFSVSSSWFDIGFTNWFRGNLEVIKSPANAYQRMIAISPYMANRATAMDRELQDMFQKLKPDQKALYFGDKSVTWEDVRNFGFAPIRIMDMVAVLPIWHGAYKKFLRESPQDLPGAIKYADNAVRRSQPSAQPLDLPHWLRVGGVTRLFSSFQTFTVGAYGQRQRLHYRAWKAGRLKSGEYAWFNFCDAIVPAFITTTMMSMIWGDDPEDEETWKGIGKDMFSYILLTGLPLIGAFFGPFGGPLDSPLATGPNEMKRTVKNIAKYFNEFDEETGKKVLWGLARVGSFISGVPATKIVDKYNRGLEQDQENIPGIKYLIPAPRR